MNVRAIRTALAAALTGEGYHVYDALPEHGELPLAAVQWPDTITYTTTLAGTSTLSLTVTVAVAAVDFAAAQTAVDAAMSTPGLGQQVETHTTTAWRAIQCTSAGNVRRMTIGTADALAVDFHFQIIA